MVRKWHCVILCSSLLTGGCLPVHFGPPFAECLDAFCVSHRSHPTVLSAAEKGSLSANYAMRWYYMDSQAEYWKWLCRAADLGSPHARMDLGAIYHWGRDQIAKDTVRAYMWYTLSEMASNKPPPFEPNYAGSFSGKWKEFKRFGLTASEARSQIANELSTSDLEKARGMVVEWKSGDCQAAWPNKPRELTP